MLDAASLSRAMVEITVADIWKRCQIWLDDWSERPSLFPSVFCCYEFYRMVVRVDVSKQHEWADAVL